MRYRRERRTIYVAKEEPNTSIAYGVQGHTAEGRDACLGRHIEAIQEGHPSTGRATFQVPKASSLSLPMTRDEYYTTSPGCIRGFALHNVLGKTHIRMYQ